MASLVTSFAGPSLRHAVAANPKRSRTIHITCEAVRQSAASLTRSVEEFYAAYNRHDLAQLGGFLSDSILYSDRVWADHDIKGKKKFLEHELEWLRACPDFKYHLDTVLARDDSEIVAVHWTARGTSTAPFRDLPATNRASVLSGVSLFIFDEPADKVKEIIVYRQANEEEKESYLVYT